MSMKTKTSDSQLNGHEIGNYRGLCGQITLWLYRMLRSVLEQNKDIGLFKIHFLNRKWNFFGHFFVIVIVLFFTFIFCKKETVPPHSWVKTWWGFQHGSIYFLFGGNASVIETLELNCTGTFDFFFTISWLFGQHF